MFDNIRCDMTLPDGRVGIEDQTKEFSCQLSTHVIDAEGQLWLDCGHSEPVPMEERPHPDPEDKTWLSLIGSQRWVPKMEKADSSHCVEIQEWTLFIKHGNVVDVFLTDPTATLTLPGDTQP